MFLRRFSATHFRNLSSVDIELSPQLNIFHGTNGSGKTSVLEAISTLSLGRSFRSRKYKNIISHTEEQYTVFGRIYPKSTCNQVDALGVPVGVQRNRQGQVQIKQRGKYCQSAAQLSELLPVRVMNGHSFSLLEGGPLVRREFMDWLVFHVEHDFMSTWKAFEKCLKHRNSLLKHDKIDCSQLSLWDAELARVSGLLDEMRRRAYQGFEKIFLGLLEGFEALQSVNLGYYRGWDKDRDYAELLEVNQQRDIDLGYTRQGPHRADIRVKVSGMPAVEVLSRGQQKIVVSAMLIAQGLMYSSKAGRSPMYLIDDLPAELDAYFRKVLATWLYRMDCQVCVTGVDKESLIEAWSGLSGKQPCIEHKVFHVEHGCVVQDEVHSAESE